MPADPVRDAEILRKQVFKPAPVYGSQLQTAALPAAKPEADLVIEWTPVKKTLADGTVVELRKPV